MNDRKLVISNIGICILLLLGLSYVSLYLVRYNPFEPPYSVTVELERTGGLYFNSDVTYMGHPVGDVTSIRPVDGIVRVIVEIRSDTKIPRDTRVAIAGLSPVGEQYLDFQPNTASGPYLQDGDVVALSDTRVPVEFATMMRHVATLADQIDPAPIRTVIDELFVGLGDSRTDVRRLVTDSDRLLGAAEETQPLTPQLLRDANTVLSTASDLRPELIRFSDDARELTEDIRNGRTTWRRALDKVPPSLNKIMAVMLGLEDPLVLMANHVTPPATILADRGPALTSLIRDTPKMARAVSRTISGGWVNAYLGFSLADAVCQYGAGKSPEPWIAPPVPFEKDRHCTTFRPNLQQRGSYFAPRP